MWRLSEPSETFLITADGGATMGVSSEMSMHVIENDYRTKIPHKVSVANIIDPMIRGMDFMEHLGKVG